MNKELIGKIDAAISRVADDIAEDKVMDKYKAATALAVLTEARAKLQITNIGD